LRLHGRGGQGAVTAAQVLAAAAIEKGLYAQAFPEFGAERRGAPVKAYTRIADEVILEREPVVNPDIVLVLDSTLSPKIYMEGLKEGGVLVINTAKKPEEVLRELEEAGCRKPGTLVTVDATSIALKLFRAPIVNTAMLGALLKVLDVIDMDTLLKVIERKLAAKGRRIIELNLQAIREANASAQVYKVSS